MIDDLVRRLNSPIKHPQECVNQRQEAAAEIERLHRLVDDLIEAAPMDHNNWGLPTDDWLDFDKLIKEMKDD